MDPIKSIGKLLAGGEARDAIHIAIMPVVSADDDWLSPGQSIGLLYGSDEEVTAKEADYGHKPQGVVDPFLKRSARKGERFWMFLFPNTITSLRHEWTHPEIDNRPQPANDTEAWLRRFAERWRIDYDELIREASGEAGGDATAQGRDLHDPRELGDDFPAFWENLEKLTGKKFDEAHRSEFEWSCSC